MGSNFCPRGSAPLEGQLLAVSSNTALFSLLGTTYGGDGRTTFGLPDARGRAIMVPEQGQGFQTNVLGVEVGPSKSSLSKRNCRLILTVLVLRQLREQRRVLILVVEQLGRPLQTRSQMLLVDLSQAIVSCMREPSLFPQLVIVNLYRHVRLSSLLHNVLRFKVFFRHETNLNWLKAKIKNFVDFWFFRRCQCRNALNADANTRKIQHQLKRLVFFYALISIRLNRPLKQ